MKTPSVVVLSFLVGTAVAQARDVPLFPAPQLELLTEPSSAATGDFNEDGRPDIAATNANAVSVFLSQGLGSFSSGAHYAAGLECSAVAVGDMDGDAHLDLIVAGYDSNDVSFLRGDGLGGFGLPTHQTVGVQPSDLVLADVDQDGFLDVAVVNEASANLVILFGNGTGQFPAATQYAVGVRPLAIVTEDFNNDGRPDFAVANSGSDSVTVLLNQGAGSLGALAPFAVGSAPMSIATGDLNLDGLPDLATADRVSNTASLLLNTGMGNFASAASLSVEFVAPLAIAIADFTGEGDDDLAIGADSFVVMHANDGFGGLLPPVLAAAGRWSLTDLITSDLNGDSSTDLMVAGRGYPFLSVLLNDGTGRLGAAFFRTGTYPQEMDSGDMNGDGHLDILTPSYFTDDVTILHGDGVGGFSVATTVSLASGSQVRSVAVGEFTSDSMSDFVVAAVGPGLDVFIQTSSGTYVLTQIALTPPQAGHSHVFVEDVDSDGNDDVVAIGYPYTYYLLGDGAGGFTQLPEIFGISNASVHFVDLNGDNRSDLVTKMSGKIRVHIATAPGAFLPPTDYAMPGEYSLALGDLNGDAFPDVLSASFGVLYVAQNDGLGCFPNVTTIPFNPGTEDDRALSSGDFDGDGDIDAVVLDYTTAFFLPGIGDGSFHDLVPFAGASSYTTLEPLVVDLNHDGRVDLVMPGWDGLAVLMPDPASRGSIELYGAGCPGTAGFVPNISLTGPPAPGGVLQLSLQGALGGSSALVLFGLTPGSTSLGNGCDLLLSQVLPPVLALPLSGFLPGTGTFSGAFSLPSGSSGFALSMQAFVSDGGVAQGYSNTNGVTLTVP